MKRVAFETQAWQCALRAFCICSQPCVVRLWTARASARMQLIYLRAVADAPHKLPPLAPGAPRVAAAEGRGAEVGEPRPDPDELVCVRVPRPLVVVDEGLVV